jgi:hypothetical protein
MKSWIASTLATLLRVTAFVGMAHAQSATAAKPVARYTMSEVGESRNVTTRHRILG